MDASFISFLFLQRLCVACTNDRVEVLRGMLLLEEIVSEFLAFFGLEKQ
jgi:hypothetical protein